MSRQRLRESNVKWTMSLTNDSQALKILKLVEIKCLENKSKEIVVSLNKKIIDFLSKNSEDDILFFQNKNKVKISFKEELNFGINDYKLEFKAKNNKIIETIQSEIIIKSESNIIKFEDKKKKFKKSFQKKPKKKFYKKNKKKTKKFIFLVTKEWQKNFFSYVLKCKIFFLKLLHLSLLLPFQLDF